MTIVSRIMEMNQPSLNDGTAEQPVPASRFCYGSNNRCGVFALALLKLVLNVVLIFALIFYLGISFMFGVPQILYHVVFLSIALFMDVVDIIIGLVTIFSIYANYQGIMKMYSLYSIYIFGSITILCCLGFYIIRRDIVHVLILFVIFLLILMMQMCLNYMLKTEVLMRRSNAPIPL